MLIYPVLLIAGLVGLLAMAALGFVHGSHAGPGSGQSHPGAGSVHTHAGHGPAGHSHPVGGLAGGASARGTGARAPGIRAPGARGPARGIPSQAAQGSSRAAEVNDAGLAAASLMWLMPLLSPLTWFSWFVGAGAAGTLAGTAHVPEPLRAGIAVAGAIGFNQAILKPIWNLIFGFASEPAGNLEACLLQTVEAVTAFDQRGEGLVRVVIDGRSEDILAQLTPEARSTGTRVRRGDRLVIEDVDQKRNRCWVSRE